MGDNDYDTALDDIAGSDITILATSISTTGDQDCGGSTSRSRDINDLYNAGILTVIAVGNDGHPTNDCKVEEPGSAIGAFAVGAHGNTVFNDESSARNGDIMGGSTGGSARGGVSWQEGRNRTIVDITAPGCRTLVPNGNTTYNFEGCSTSQAAPTAAGFAADYVEYFKENFSNSIDDPGNLHAHMLLMGDREFETSGASGLNTGYSSVWGAGRMKMRLWGADGLDGPADFTSIETCISHGEDYKWYPNHGSSSYLPSDAEAFKAVMYFFDSKHEVGFLIDDIDFIVEQKIGSSWYLVQSDVDRYDEKKRVFFNPVYAEYRIRIVGNNVTTDDAGCGQNSQRVHIAYFWEDSDRESWENLDGVDEEKP